MRMISLLEKSSLLALSAVVAGLAFFGGYNLISHLGKTTAQSSPAGAMAGTSAEATPDSGSLRFSDESGTAGKISTSAIPVMSEEGQDPDTSSAFIGTFPESKIDPDKEAKTVGIDPVPERDPLEHRERVDGDFVDLLSTSPRSIVVSTTRSSPRGVSDTLSSGPEDVTDFGLHFESGIPPLLPLVIDLPGLAGEFSFEPLILSAMPESLLTETEVAATLKSVPDVSASIEAGALLPEGGSPKRDAVAEVEVGITASSNPLTADKKSGGVAAAEIEAPASPARRVRAASPPAPRPGTIYGNALGGSISGLIGGLSAPPLDSEVNYRPAGLTERRSLEMAVPEGTLPAIAPQVNVGVNPGSSNGLLPQTSIDLPSGIGVGIGGFDIRVNTIIDIP